MQRPKIQGISKQRYDPEQVNAPVKNEQLSFKTAWEDE